LPVYCQQSWVDLGKWVLGVLLVLSWLTGFLFLFEVVLEGEISEEAESEHEKD